uniref:Tubulin-specific chaperone A n=1 Tax=Prymnesium polylepis TaxID=72548 RepID=A0A6V4AS82_9EUKA|mmetsp:Transcript_56160/g.154356  ORF Transcript_56160/g.154356 Transcript_56160/m.154356 type:complete len:119 (-) Transcript_56160:336-692(-)
MSKNEIKDLKIKTSSCARTIKDLEYSKKEIAKQVDRIQQYTDDPERDIHDVKKQEEVLAEMHAGVPTEIDQLDKYLNLLQDIIEQYADNADIKATEEYSKAIEVERQAAKVLEEYRPS